MEIRFDKGWSWERIEKVMRGQEKYLIYEISVSSPTIIFSPSFTLTVWTQDKKREIMKTGFYPYDCMVSEAIHFVVEKMIKIEL